MRKIRWLGIALAAIGALFQTSTAQAFMNGQNAGNVIGQLNFVTANTGTSQSLIHSPYSTAYDAVHKRLFMVDWGNYRVLVYDLSGGVTTNGMTAQYVLGQPDFTSNGRSLTQNGFYNGPSDVLYDPTDDWLFVADGQYGRLLVFDFADDGISNGLNAHWVLGEPDFTTNTLWWAFSYTMTAQTIQVTDMSFDTVHRRLFVATGFDGGRVLVFDFNATPISNFMPANYVLGASDFNYRPNGSGPPPETASSFEVPNGVAYDSARQRLYVGDSSWERITVFDLSNGITNNMNASWVIGQPDFTTAGAYLPAPARNGFTPGRIHYDSSTSQLFVIDSLNYRILVFNMSGGMVPMMNATNVLGQSDFTSNISHGGQNGLLNPMDMEYAPDFKKLFMADGLERVMVFDQDPLSGPNPCASTLSICGTVKAAEDGVTALSGIPMQLQDDQGRLLKTIKSDNGGLFVFSGLTQNATYYVVPILGRQESASPVRSPVPNLPNIGASVDMQIRGYPGTLQVTGAAPGTTVLISTYVYTGQQTPTLSPFGSANYYAGTFGLSGSLSQQLPSGNYYVTCWTANASGANVIYSRTPQNGSQGPATVTLGQFTSLACGQ